jgi:drug/metabolite transporter (DMT)-like permease
VVPLEFIGRPLIILVGWWLYGERPDAFVFLGGGGIVFGVLWKLRLEATRKVGNAR